MSWSGGAWPCSRTRAKLSLTPRRFTLGRKSAREHWFPAKTHDSARPALKPGSISPPSVPPDTNEALKASLKAKGPFMTFRKLILVLACLISGTLAEQEGTLTQLMSTATTHLPGTAALMIIVA